MTQDDKTLLDQILWTDKATFKINDGVNRYNCVYWSDKNPQYIIGQGLNVSQAIIWERMWSNGAIVPFFFEGNIRSEKCLRMLMGNIKPQLRTFSLSNSYLAARRCTSSLGSKCARLLR